jgi:hypothetical protein
MKKEDLKVLKYSNLFKLIRDYLFTSLNIESIRHESMYVSAWIVVFLYFVFVGIRILKNSYFHILEVVVSAVTLSALFLVGKRFGNRSHNGNKPVDLEITLKINNEITLALIESGVDISDENQVKRFVLGLIKNHEKKDH